jgi:hypothetical protein
MAIAIRNRVGYSPWRNFNLFINGTMLIDDFEDFNANGLRILMRLRFFSNF